MFWGPLQFVFDVAPGNKASGLFLCALLIPMLLAFPIKPRLWTALLSTLAVIFWLLLGVVGLGIGC